MRTTRHSLDHRDHEKDRENLSTFSSKKERNCCTHASSAGADGHTLVVTID